MGLRFNGQNTYAHKFRSLRTVTWNVRSLLNDAQNQTPEKKTAFATVELQRYNIDIAAVSKTRSLGNN